MNALDASGAARSRVHDRERRTLEGFGYSCEELDLRDHFAEREELPQRLAGLDLVWVVGGNAFVLARAMTRARFRDALAAQFPRREFTYGGCSAGACVAGPDLRGTDLIDDPAVLPDGYSPTAAPECLGLVPYRIVPHWRSGQPESGSANNAAAHLTEHGLAHRCLRDGEAVNAHDITGPAVRPTPRLPDPGEISRRAPNRWSTRPAGSRRTVISGGAGERRG
ncbi:Type 1 glutamine amidotransferase-like domain-containing protein [Saccharopolyspora sp. NFXS83]|uniref:Type 1 glutamine amidotransferase-like domain-containing protein n=1 Tax=Saccharopolyspora sp. NFXS83 TaxID=2993560 RepID=UPI00224B5B60|nr:Type 1 glutamine amidotransferase-like domain-containing protein [Saccharopolyspora sp. NFXS83]MCX2731935.1 Type 1 glutamine amidotransferase-like domain-containing protein [Saccharopolyspora sp. NFXS83]